MFQESGGSPFVRDHGDSQLLFLDLCSQEDPFDEEPSNLFVLRRGLEILALARDTSFRFFTDPFGVSFGLFLCLVDLFAHLCDPGTRRLYIDNKTLAIGRTNNPPFRESWIS
jgi:hypothetical protein